jgi:hypothetical protein
VTVNGAPGLLVVARGRLLAVPAFSIVRGKIVEINISPTLAGSPTRRMRRRARGQNGPVMALN